MLIPNVTHLLFTFVDGLWGAKVAKSSHNCSPQRSGNKVLCLIPPFPPFKRLRYVCQKRGDGNVLLHVLPALLLARLVPQELGKLRQQAVPVTGSGLRIQIPERGAQVHEPRSTFIRYQDAGPHSIASFRPLAAIRLASESFPRAHFITSRTSSGRSFQLRTIR